MVTPRIRILSQLEQGPKWTRSFHAVKALVEQLVVEGRVERVKPPNGRGANMVALTEAGRLELEEARR